MKKTKKKPTRPKVIRTRRAGRDHAVLTVVGGGTDYCRRPCATCPWRVDAVGVFPAAAFGHSAHTANDMATETFACHQAGAARATTCAGFLLRGAAHNLTVRLRVIQGEIDLGQVTDGGVRLHANYVEMAVANGVKRTDPALRACRDNG